MKKDNCKQCQAIFRVTVNRTTFCSHPCQGAFNLKTAKRTFRKRDGKDFECLVCKTVFYAQKHRVDAGKVKYCSRSCTATAVLPKYADSRLKPTNRPKHRYKTIWFEGKQLRLHRHIMEQHLGRKLERWEHVHHINDDSFDNRIENLQVLSNSEHQKIEMALRRKIISSSLPS